MTWDFPDFPNLRVNLEQLTYDHCEVCGLRLYPSERVEVTRGAQPGMTEVGVGGGGVTAVYCPAHVPEGAP